MSWIVNPEIWAALLTLTVLEIVLGIDNIVFISILTGKLPASQQAKARRVGLSLALFTRIMLLLSLAWVASLTSPLATVFGRPISWRELVLLAGGLFLLAKSTREIHENLEAGEEPPPPGFGASFWSVVAQVVLLDIVFSLDSVITAIGMANQVGVMVAAIVIAIGIMLAASGSLSTFVNRHPTIKMLALSFLLLIGMSLVAEGLGQHISKGYIYFAMGFAVLVEGLNLRAGHRAAAVEARAQSELRS